MIVNLAKTNRNIEQFDFENANLDEETVVDIVRIASKLKSLRLRYCRVFATASHITKIVNVRKCNQENTNKLKLWIHKRNKDDLESVNTNEIQQYLNLDFSEF